MKMQSSKKGFTLIELAVVMAIMGVLAVVVIAAIRAATQSRTRTQNMGNARTIEAAMEAHAQRFGGNYCGGAAVGGVAPVACPAAGATFDAIATAYQTGGYINNWSPGACTGGANAGGGRATAFTSQSATLQIVDQTCTTDWRAITH